MQLEPRSQRDSIWQDGPGLLRPRLEQDTTADVCIVGAGIAGISIAHELVSRGLSVVVLDDGPIGGGETGRTTAHLCSALDDRCYRLENMFGESDTRLVVQAHAGAVHRIERLVAAEGIKCDFRRLNGYLLRAAYLETKQAEELLVKELEATLRAGIRCDRIDAAPGIAGPPWPALRFPDQAQFSPLHYLSALVDLIERAGGRTYSSTHAAEFKGGSKAHVTCAHGPVVRADHVVLATNTPVNDRVTMHTKQSAHRSYVAAFQCAAPPEIALWWDGFWDPDEPYHYARFAQRDGETVLIVGGEDHKTGQADDGVRRWDRVEEWTRQCFPSAGDLIRRWSGQIMEPHDELAYIGRNPSDHPNVYIVTGDSGNGMTYATIAAELIPDLIQGKDHQLATILSPSRLPLHVVARAAKDNLNTAAQYRDWVAPHHGPDGEPHVERHGLHPVVLCETPEGGSVRCSAVCPHLGGIVRWNAAEHTWDCPCHGSRFDRFGRVINGPANTDLRPLPHADAPASEALPAKPTI